MAELYRIFVRKRKFHSCVKQESRKFFNGEDSCFRRNGTSFIFRRRRFRLSPEW
ncbi:MAG: hypothetical protein ACR2QC_12225 [Gammaproteobacteria bacterium]